MKYSNRETLRDGSDCIIRNAERKDAILVCDLILKCHQETDFLLSYPEENTHTPETEGDFLEETLKSENSIEIVAEVNGQLVGSAGVNPVGSRYKLKHRADFGISVLKEYWGLGIGTALLQGCIQCAKEAGYKQLELDVVADNKAAISLYQKEGFIEYGRNPRGFVSKYCGYQELVLMRLSL